MTNKPATNEAAAHLAAQAAIAQAAGKKSTYAAGIISSSKSYLVSPDDVVVMPDHNSRFDFGDIEALAEQIREQHAADGVGVLRALIVRRSTTHPGKFDLGAGERRIRAVRLCQEKYGLKFDKGIPVEILPKETTDLELQLRDVNDNNAKPYLPLEEAHAFLKLRKFGLTIEQIAARTGRGHHHVRVSLQMLETDEEVLKAVQDGTIGVTLAKELGDKMKGDKEAQREVVRELRAAGKDKKAKAAAKKAAKAKVQTAKEKRAERQGRELKMRALTDEQLSALGAKVAKSLEELLKDAGYAAFPDGAKQLEREASTDNKLAAAFTLGALQALKAAAGMKINLTL